MQELCGSYPTASTEPLVPEPVDAEVSFAVAVKSVSWRVVGLRFKLCVYPTKKLAEMLQGGQKIRPGAPLPEDIAKNCEPTLRVVAQPLDFSAPYAAGGFGSAAFDFATHLNYLLPKEQIPELLETILRIKAHAMQEGHPTSNTVQGIHPGFGYPDFDWYGLNTNTSFQDMRELREADLEQAMSFARVLRREWMPFLGRDNLKDVEFFGTYVDQLTRTTGAMWVYAAFDANATGLRPKSLPFVGGSQVMTYRGQPRAANETFAPSLTNGFRRQDNAQSLADLALSRSFPPAAGSLNQALQQVANLEDPTQVNIKGSECIGCPCVSG